MKDIEQLLTEFLSEVDRRLKISKEESINYLNEQIKALNLKSGSDGKDGRDGKDGVNGKDGLSLEDFSARITDGRNLVICLSRGETKKEVSLKIPFILDRGVYAEGKAYECGDAVTYGGSLWIAQKDSPEGKPGNSEDWRLAVKKGRDLK